jgi:hypothetical protein
MSIMQRLYDSEINALVCSFSAWMGADGPRVAGLPLRARRGFDNPTTKNRVPG